MPFSLLICLSSYPDPLASGKNRSFDFSTLFICRSVILCNVLLFYFRVLYITLYIYRIPKWRFPLFSHSLCQSYMCTHKCSVCLFHTLCIWMIYSFHQRMAKEINATMLFSEISVDAIVSICMCQQIALLELATSTKIRSKFHWKKGL